MDDQTYHPARVWQAACDELQLQLPRQTFDTWLRNARLVAHEDGTFIIGVQNIYAREWLEQRLKRVVLRTLSRITQRTVEVRFVLAAAHAGKGREEAEEIRTAGPLLAELRAEQEETPRFEHLAPGETGLNPRQTFDTYAVGVSNRLVHAAALAVVEEPATRFNPLVIHGGVGLGKSHLLHAIGNAFAQNGRRALYAAAETFTNDLVAAIRYRSTSDFRDKYRNVDVLLVDDIHFLAGKSSTEEEFYHTFNALFDANAQVVVALSRAPGEIRGLDSRLRSRFEGGLVVGLQPPDYLTRLDILELKARQRGFDGRLPAELLERIAEIFDGSVRELEGALNRVLAATMLEGKPPPPAEIERMRERPRSINRAPLSLEDIVMAVADYYGVSPQAMCGRDRSRDVSTARQVAMYVANKEGDIPLQQIGEMMGNRNHSTVLYSCERIGDLVATDSVIRRQVGAILRLLRGESTHQQNPRPG